MADEINAINDKCSRQMPGYVLIGPEDGEQGQVPRNSCNLATDFKCKGIVEVDLPDFHLDASLGSHFFHNVTSMNVGYFSINQGSNDSKLTGVSLPARELLKREILSAYKV